MSIVKEGDFKSLKLDEGELEMLEDAYQAVSKSNRWAFLKREDVPGKNGFMFSNLPELKDIDTYMEYSGHSGSSYGWTMRNMEYIAKNGWDAYVKLKGLKPKPISTPQTLNTVMNFARSAPTNLNEFVDAIEKDKGMREMIPNIDEQAAAMRKFANGQMSYAEMRSLCG